MDASLNNMDEDMADYGDGFWYSEIDFEYEFEACRFFDFTRLESDAEAHEAERWFHSAPSYPPSPFIVKLNLDKDFSLEVEKSSSPKVQGSDKLNSIRNNSNVAIDHEVSSAEMNTKGLKHQNHSKGTAKAETKPAVKSIKPRASTLLKPTASHLAKQKKARDLNSNRLGRLQSPSSKMSAGSLQKSPGHEIEATKRQKLETGYLRKVAHLKHQNSMLHKIVKKVGQLEGNSIYSRLKVTVPLESDLETAQRAQRRSFRSKNVPDSTQRARPNAHGFKARPLNRKVGTCNITGMFGSSTPNHGIGSNFHPLNSFYSSSKFKAWNWGCQIYPNHTFLSQTSNILQAPSLPLPKKSMPPVPEFQVFHLKTTERALQHKSANILNTHNRRSALHGVDVHKARHLDKIFPSVEDESLIQNGLPQDPPTELFNKLSLRSDTETNTVYQSKQHRSTKGSKENAPTSIQPEFWRCPGKLNQCGNERRVPEVGCQHNINRSVGIW